MPIKMTWTRNTLCLAVTVLGIGCSVDGESSPNAADPGTPDSRKGEETSTPPAPPGSATDAGTPDGGSDSMSPDGGGPDAEVRGPIDLSALLPKDRFIDWTTAGVPGGIPNRTVLCGTVQADVTGANDATAIFQAAIDGCPKDQVVYVPAGTYRIAGRLFIDHSMVLRGAGPGLTTLKVEGNEGARGHIVVGPRTWPSFHEMNWTAGFAKGDTTVTLSDTSGLKVGQEIWLDQLNDTSLVNPVGNEGLNCCSGRTGTDFGNGGHTRAAIQITQIKAINGNVVTLDEPLYHGYDPALVPQVVSWDSGSVRWAGVEDLLVDGAGVGENSSDWGLILFELASDCWAKNVEVAHISTRGLNLSMAYKMEVRDSYLREAGRVGSVAYGLPVGNTSHSLIENNMFSGLVAPIMFGYPNSGNVVGYNYMTKNAPGAGWLYADIAMHDAHNYQMLYEGNVAGQVGFDVIHGSASHVSVFRNRFSGTQPGKSSNRFAVVVAAWNRDINLLGNILGTAGYHTRYEETAASHGSDEAIYDVGYFRNYYDGLEGYDQTTYDTLFRHGNFEYATNSVKWDPSTANHTLPPSFYRSSKPAWLGATPWPAIGPDVDGKVSKIPAQLRCEKTPGCE